MANSRTESRKLVQLTLLALLILSGCALPIKSIVYLRPDLKDHKRMHAHKLKAPEQPFCFYQNETKDFGDVIKVNDWSPAVVPLWRSLNELVEAHPNQALVIIRNDTILYEHYDDDANRKLHPSYSVAKSFTSALVGFALQDGLIPSLDELVDDYLPDWSKDPRWKRLRLKHLLNHTSGIEHPLTVDGLLYYGSYLGRAQRFIKFVNEPGTNQAYMNMNVWLLSQVLEKVTGKPLSDYLQEKIWTPLGMESDAKWSADRKDRVKSYCCIQATALDYAKFGRLYLKKGNWQGKQLLNEEWISTSLSRDTTEGGTYGYHNCWYIGYKDYNDFMAIGLYKQHIYINPDRNIIIVSLNDRPRSAAQKALNWEDIFRQIVDQL
jgi:CubicO group peptidase (beta-lactamase class C family)